MTPMINKERSSNRIEACLKTDDADAHFSHSLSVGLNYGATRTRPPLIGREVSLEPDKNNRYSSEETQLTKYLNALERKMAQNRSGKIGNESSPSISPPSVDAVNVKDNSNKASKFLKTSSNRTLQSAVKPTYAAVSNPGRMSAALQKAQILSNKYKAPQRTKLISDGNVPHQEQVPIALQIGVNDGKESTISNTAIDADSLRSILDVRNLIDLSSSSQSYNNEISNDKEDIKISANDDEYSDGTDSFKLQVKTIKDLSESLPSSVLSDRGHKVLNNNREVSLHSQIDENYSDDFEKSTSSLSQEVSEMDNSSPLDSRRHIPRINSPKINIPSPIKKVAHQETQTVDDVFEPRAFLSNGSRVRPAVSNYVDPPRVSSTIVNQESFEALSSYKPSLLILDDMMKQHLYIAKLFIESSRQNYMSAVSTLTPNYTYTTWKSTQRILERNRIKKSRTVNN